MTEALRSGWVSSIGAFVDRFEREFAAFCGVDHAVAVSNGTDALFITLRSLGVGPGDEVIVPAMTFAAVAAVVVHCGAEPVFVDIEADYWCLDVRAVERALSPRSKAIVAVHSYGHPADMGGLTELAGRHGVALVEDCAEAHGASCRGKTVGSIGRAGCFSFYGNKIITTGEGGMITTSDAELAARARFLKDHAMDPTRRYVHTEAGFNCRLTNLQAALGCAQMERLDELQANRRRVLEIYREELHGLDRIRLNPRAAWADPVVWMVCVVGDDRFAEQRDRVAALLRDRGIDSRPFFVPLPELPPYRHARVHGTASDGAPVARRISRAGLNLPSGHGLTEADARYAAAGFRAAIEACS